MNVEVYRKLYPDLAEKGGMVNAVKLLLGQNPDLAVNGYGASYTHIQCGDRSGQISIGAEERRFAFNLWAKGDVLANGEHADFERVVQVIKDWVTTEKSAENFEQQVGFVHARSNHPKCNVKPGAYLISGNTLKKI